MVMCAILRRDLRRQSQPIQFLRRGLDLKTEPASCLHVVNTALAVDGPALCPLGYGHGCDDTSGDFGRTASRRLSAPFASRSCHPAGLAVAGTSLGYRLN